MLIMNISSLKAPQCAHCNCVTKLCTKPADRFAFVWKCSSCGIVYDHISGEEIDLPKQLTQKGKIYEHLTT